MSKHFVLDIETGRFDFHIDAQKVAEEDQQRRALRDPADPATRSEGALEKAATKVLEHGSPAHSFRTLLNELSTIVRNTYRRKNANDSEETFELDTRPNPRQPAALDLLKTIRV